MRTLTTRAFAIALAGLALPLVTACGSSGTEDKSGAALQSDVTRSMATVINDVEGLSTLNAVMSGAEIGSIFDGPGSYTLLAPNDAAFKALGAKADELASVGQRPILVALLRKHTLPGHLTPANIRAAIEQKGGPVTMTTLGESKVTFALDGETLTVAADNGVKATLTETATEANNGVIIPVSKVLIADGAE